MNAENKKKIADIFTNTLKNRIERKPDHWDTRDFIESIGLEVIERTHEKKEWWEDKQYHYRRLLPPPKDDNKSVCVKLWSYPGPGRSSLDPQIWVRLDRDLALKILILGTLPETIQPEGQEFSADSSD